MRGRAIEVAVALSIRMEMESGPDADLEGREEMREMIDSSEQRNSSGHRGGGEIGGVGLRGGALVTVFPVWRYLCFQSLNL